MLRCYTALCSVMAGSKKDPPKAPPTAPWWNVLEVRWCFCLSHHEVDKQNYLKCSSVLLSSYSFTMPVSPESDLQ